MKRILLFIAMSHTFNWISCTNQDDSSPTSNNGGVDPMGAFRIKSYIDKGRDQTTDYGGLIFDFKDNGVLTATKSSSVTTGTWKRYIDSGKTKLDIFFPSTTNLDELNEDWEVLGSSSTSFNLKHISGGNGGESMLEFVK